MADIKNLVMGIAIFILTVSVGIYGINTFYKKAPVYNDYCPNIINEIQCTNDGGVWINNSYQNSGTIPPEKAAAMGYGYCNYDYNICQKKWDNAQKEYSKGVFFIALPMGIIAMGIGALVFGLASVGGGLMAGGVGILFYGVVQYWQYADDILKFILSLIGLIVVIALAYYANNKWFKKRK